MVVKNPTVWSPPSGRGYVTASGLQAITTQTNVNLLTQSGNNLLINPDIYSPLNTATWTLTPKNQSGWMPQSGFGYVITVGAEDLTTNDGSFMADNLGNLIVTTPTYNTGKNTTNWTLSGA